MKEIVKNFVPGLDLADDFFHETVRPIIDRRFPGLPYSAGKLHGGSDVLGFDTAQSMDHDWGPSKFDLFLRDEDYEALRGEITEVLTKELPDEFRGVPTRFLFPERDGGRVGLPAEGAVAHRIQVTTMRRFFWSYIGLNPAEEMSPVDWLLLPQQLLRTISCGRVFHDGLEQLRAVQRKLRWYPMDVWLYLLACQWRKIDQEEPFMARCGDVGDELGSRVVAVRMVDELMRLCFFMERQYWPYYKWFGTAFAKLECAADLTPIFHSILNSQNWDEREEFLSAAYLYVAGMHNNLGLTKHVEPEIRRFHSRPYRVLHSERFVEALYGTIRSEAVLRLPRNLGGVAQFLNSTETLDWVERCRRLEVLYCTDHA